MRATAIMHVLQQLIDRHGNDVEVTVLTLPPPLEDGTMTIEVVTNPPARLRLSPLLGDDDDDPAAPSADEEE